MKRWMIAAGVLLGSAVAAFIPIPLEVSPAIEVSFVAPDGQPHIGTKVYRSWGSYYRSGPPEWRLTDDTGSCRFPRQSTAISVAERLQSYLHSKLPFYLGTPLLNGSGVSMQYDDKTYMPVRVEDCAGNPADVSQVANDGSLTLGIRGVGEDRCLRVIRQRR